MTDFKAARSHLNDDMTFLAPIASHNSADAYLEGNERLRSKYGIKKVLYEVKKVFVDGDDVCVFFDFNLGSATLFASGWFHVVNGKISSIRVVLIHDLLLNCSPRNSQYQLCILIQQLAPSSEFSLDW